MKDMVLALALLAACHGKGSPARVRHVPAKALWSFDPKSYFSDRDFHASAFSRDLVVLANVPPGGSGGAIGVVALDVATGAELWRKDQLGWVLHPPHATDPLYFAPFEKLGAYTEAYTHVDRLDPRTGAVTSTVKLDRTPELDFELRMAWSSRALLAIGRDTMTAFDWTSGKPLWSTPVPDSAYLFEPLVMGDRVVLPNTTNLVLSLADGQQLAAIPGECCTAIASPDGAHLFVRAAVDATDELAPDLTVARRLAGEMSAASNSHYAVEIHQAAPKSAVVQVFAYGTADPVMTLTPQGDHDFYSAVALSGRTLFYFHDADATFYQVDLATGAAEAIEKIGSHFVLSTDVVGSAGPFLGTPPIIERPYMFTEEWGIHGYLVGEE